MNPFRINPYVRASKQYLSQMLEHKYPPHDEIVERIAHGFAREQDAASFYKLIAEIYEAGYMSCLKQYEEKLKEHGLKVKVVPKD